MKNKLLSLIAAAALAGCSSQKNLIQRSAICITNRAETQVWFMSCAQTELIIKTWQAGSYGPALVQVVSEPTFRQLEKQAVNRSKNN